MDPFHPPGWSPAEPRWRLGASVEIRQGLGLLGASDGCGPAFARCLLPGVVPPARLEGDPTATVLRGALWSEVRPVQGVALALSARAQHSARPLFAFEEFSAGNYTVGRGYDPGTLLGDSGIGVQAELRFGSLVPAARGAVSFQPFLFVDSAKVWNEDRILAGPPSQSLASAGGGVRAAWDDRARLELTLAAPLRRAGMQAERGEPRLLLSFTTRLWPWSLR